MESWRLQAEVVPACEKEPEGLSADKLTVVLESSRLNATELSAYCREWGLLCAGEPLALGGPRCQRHAALTGRIEGARVARAKDEREIKALYPQAIP